MLCAKLYGKGDLRLEEVPTPVPAEGEIVVKTRACAVCGTDVRMLQNGNPAREEPVILGHEFAGTIAAVGDGVAGYRAGERVAVAPNYGCGVCDMCVSGNTHHCARLRGLGVHTDGGFAEYIRIPRQAVAQGNVFRLAPDTPFEDAGVNEAFSCAFAGFSRCRLQPGETALIVGAGAIGIMHAKLALLAGAKRVVLSDLSQERLRRCAELSPRFIAASGDLKDFLDRLTGGRGADVIITACPSPEVQQASLSLAALNGRINFFGGLPKDRELVPLNTNLVHYRQLVITGSTRSSLSDYRRTMDFIESGLVGISELVTARLPLERIHDALSMTARAEGLKTAIVFA